MKGLATLGLLLFVTGVYGCGYKTCPQSYDSKKIQLHIISHSHDDVGWLKTPDGYYSEDVVHVLDNVVKSLSSNSKRRFVEVEIYFFKRWWLLQPKEIQTKVHELVNSGQLAFANGGWCINDEAVAHYNNIIDQMTFGIQFIRDTFGECAEPKLSWQIDPFGASREMAHLFSLMGFDAHILNRGNQLHGEFLWNASDYQSQIFSSVLHSHYSAPNGFNFEDADEINDKNKADKAKKLVELAKNWNQQYGNKGHVLIPFGDDFRYQHAERWFSNLDRLIDVVNREYPEVNLFYSSPHCYIKAVKDTKPKLEVRSKDYFPLWTGYYSSRPVVKSLDRYANNLLQAGKQLEVLSGLTNTQSYLYEGSNELAVLQHHDAITGTSRPFVMVDYKERLTNAIHSLQTVISQSLNKLTKKNYTIEDRDSGPFVYATVNISDAVAQLDSTTYATIIYNPLAHQHSQWIRIPIAGTNNYALYDSEGNEVKNISLVPIANKVKELIGHRASITHELVFEANLPALGFTTYFINKLNEKLETKKKDIEVNSDNEFVLKGKNVEFLVDKKNGKLKYVVKDNRKHRVEQGFYYYINTGTSSTYEFCPTGGAVDLTDYDSTVESAAEYDGFYEINQKVNNWISQTIRVYKDSEYAEFDWVIGPVGNEFGVGKEIVSRFTTDFETESIFYTDSNGRQNIKRVRSEEVRECHGTHNTISYNYYPACSRVIVRDEQDKLELSILTDRSVGASSLDDGQVETMLHRCLFDHGDIPLNDIDIDGKGVVARGKLFMHLNQFGESADNYRQQSQQLVLQPIVAFDKVDNIAQYRKDHNVMETYIKSKLPDNIHLLTLENWGDVQNNEVLVRFENFYQSSDESKQNLSTPSNLNLKDIFSNIQIEKISKTNLIGGTKTEIQLANTTVQPQNIQTFVYKVKRDSIKKECQLKWNKLVNKQLPNKALLAGKDIDGQPLYVCRHKDFDMIPGKFNQHLNCRISYGGKEEIFADSEIEILTAENSWDYQWVPRHGGDSVPADAFIAGQKTSKVPIYIGRCAIHNGLIVGKIDEYFYYSYDNKENKDKSNHQILTC